MSTSASSRDPREGPRGEVVDLVADLNDMDDDGNGWSLLADARDVSLVAIGGSLIAGNSQAVAVVRVLATDDDGQVHFEILNDRLA